MRISFVTENTIDVASDVNASLVEADGLIVSRVSFIQPSPPGSPVDGMRVGVSTGASGEFSGKGGQIAIYVANGGFWAFSEPALCVLDNALYLSHAGTWKVLSTAT